MKKAQAGSVESNDILITVSESDTLEINITSIVSAFSMIKYIKLLLQHCKNLILIKLKLKLLIKAP
jgi:citrate lyase gamma subunit